MENNLPVPQPRRSVEVTNELREIHRNPLLINKYRMNVSSHLDKNELKGRMDPQSETLFRKNNTCDSLAYDDSSLGLIDVDKVSVGTNLLTKVQNDLKSLSFNAKEISGRSTFACNNHKENQDPNRNNFLLQKTSLSIDEILHDANKQSEAVDEMLKESEDPSVAGIRSTLGFYRQSISGNVDKVKDSWNCTSDFSRFSTSEQNYDMKDSMFAPANKVDLSKDELSWMKEHGDLPVPITSATFTSGSDKSCVKLSNDTVGDFPSLRSNVSDVSKISLGRYFQRRSDNIGRILPAPSPEKNGPFPPLLDIDEMSTIPSLSSETYKKDSDVVTDSLPFHTLSDESDIEGDCQSMSNDVAILSHVNNKYVEKPSVCRNITNIVDEDTTYGSPISQSQIKNFIENFDAEKKSLLLDNLLAQNKNKKKNGSDVNYARKKLQDGRINQETYQSTEKNRNISPTLPDRSSFGYTTNMFHSTKHEDEFLESNYKSANKTAKSSLKGQLEYEAMKSTKCRGISKSGSSQILNTSSNDEFNSESTLKMFGKSNSGSSGYTESSTRSTGTVVQVPLSSSLEPIQEAAIKNTYNNKTLSPGVTSANQSHNENSLSDTSKEIMNIMSQDKSYGIVDEDERDKTISPIKGNWISVESKDQIIAVGSPHTINMKLTTLSHRWISIELSVASLSVDNQLYHQEDIISQFLLLKTFASPLLLDADSKITCKLNTMVLVANKLLKINVSLKLTDMVTKEKCCVKHEILMMSKLPQIDIKCSSIKSESIHFPSLPEGVDAFIPIILFNNSNSDLPLCVSISCPYKDVFSICNVAFIPQNDGNKYLHSTDIYKKTINSVGVSDMKLFSNMEYFTLLKDESTCLKILLHYRAPHINDLEKLNDIQYLDGLLNINIVPQWKPDFLIPLKTFSIIAGVGVWRLVIQTKQNTNELLVNKGFSESIGVSNGGLLDIDYNIYIADSETPLQPSKHPVFILDKCHVYLKPGEKTSITITYPKNDSHGYEEIQKKLVFACFFKSEEFNIVGISANRSNSQQSVCSVDSVASQAQEGIIKSTKRELSWGALKIGSSQVKEIAFKNTLSDKKIKIIAVVDADCFKLFGENGPAPSITFILLPQECKTIRVEFKPHKAGGFMGPLKILQQRKTCAVLLSKIMLYGVGDVSMLVFKDGVFKHGGSQNLPLGSLVPHDVKDIHFSIWNKGTAPAFVMLNLDLKWKYRTLHKDIKVIPQCGVVAPNSVLRCIVRVPQKIIFIAGGQPGDIEKLATLNILHGDDSTRQRIKNICSQNIIDESLKEMWNKESQGKLESLCMHFPDEDKYIGNFKKFNETPVVLKSLLDELQQKEVSVTYDIDLDSTIVRVGELDETVQFHSMYGDTES